MEHKSNMKPLTKKQLDKVLKKGYKKAYPKLHEQFEHHQPQIVGPEGPWTIHHDTKGVSFEDLYKQSMTTEIRKVSTLEGMEDKLLSGRRHGNTTRLIDNAIQIIFSGNICVVEDHHDMGSHKVANKHLFDKILKRLNSEHGRETMYLHYDVSKLEIRFDK